MYRPKALTDQCSQPEISRHSRSSNSTVFYPISSHFARGQTATNKKEKAEEGRKRLFVDYYCYLDVGELHLYFAAPDVFLADLFDDPKKCVFG